MNEINELYEIAPQQWPGWSLNSHSFNGEFDVAARERMIKGGQALLNTLDKYSYLLGYSVLEVGPFFNPLFVQLTRGFSQSTGFKNIALTYLENDKDACEWLRKQAGATIINSDANRLADLQFSQHIPNHQSFSSIILSQVINYINFDEFSSQINRHLSNNGLLFINNVINYGIPEYFSPFRPHSIEETMTILKNYGFVVLEKLLLPPPRRQDDARLIVVAQKINSMASIT
jgi:hypothetical protein